MQASLDALPAAWLRPLPEGYTIPIWRWMLLPATAIMLRRYRGVWITGELRLTPDHVSFTQAKMIKSATRPPEAWNIPLESISNVAVQKGMMSETIEIRFSGGTVKLMTARSSEFVARLNQAVQGR